MSANVYIALGSNIENREEYLRLGLKLLSSHPKIHLTKISSIYETDPIGYLDQPSFLNMVAEANVDISALELLQFTQNIEKKAQRKKTIHWGPRTLDLDILLYNQENIKMDELCIPHPRLSERAFVVVPLHEIHPTINIPVLDKSVDTIYQEIADKEGVKVWKQQAGVGEFGLFES